MQNWTIQIGNLSANAQIMYVKLEVYPLEWGGLTPVSHRVLLLTKVDGNGFIRLETYLLQFVCLR